MNDSPATETPDALHGVTVLDFSRFMPGPFAAWLLADYGANVIRIENPREVAKQEALLGWSSTSDANRRVARAAQVYARNKRSLQIDPGHEQGRAALLQLIARADVLVEDYRPGVMESMGYGYAAMAALNPRLVYCSVSFAGQTGPYSRRPGHDPLALSLAGVLSLLSNSPQPQMPNVPVADVVAGCLGAFGILAALRARETTGRGQWVDAAMSDAATVMLGAPLWRNGGDTQVPLPTGKWVPKGGLWECGDGRFVCTSDMEPRFWEKFCQTLGRPDYAALQGDRSRWDEMHATFAAIFRTQPRDAWIERLSAAGTQYMPVYTVDEAFRDPHNIARGMPQQLPVGDRTVAQFGPPVKLSDTPGRIRHVAPLPGADNDTVLREFGFDAAQIAALRVDGVLRD